MWLALPRCEEASAVVQLLHVGHVHVHGSTHMDLGLSTQLHLAESQQGLAHIMSKRGRPRVFSGDFATALACQQVWTQHESVCLRNAAFA